jgi:hypothetical protein
MAVEGGAIRDLAKGEIDEEEAIERVRALKPRKGAAKAAGKARTRKRIGPKDIPVSVGLRKVSKRETSK